MCLVCLFVRLYFTICHVPSHLKLLVITFQATNGAPALEKKGIQITASGGSVTLTAMTSEPQGCGAFQIIPTASLGYNYIAFVGKAQASSINPSQLGLLAVEDATKIIVRLKSGSGMQFFFNNTFYNDKPGGSNQLIVSMNKGDTFQMRSVMGVTDVTGTFVLSQKKVNCYMYLS